jgi:hypothetical protein
VPLEQGINPAISKAPRADNDGLRAVNVCVYDELTERAEIRNIWVVAQVKPHFN